MSVSRTAAATSTGMSSYAAGSSTGNRRDGNWDGECWLAGGWPLGCVSATPSPFPRRNDPPSPGRRRSAPATWSGCWRRWRWPAPTPEEVI
jgi:hypothetical protein